MADPVQVAKEVGDVVQSPPIAEVSVAKEVAVVVGIVDNMIKLAKETGDVVESPPIGDVSVAKLVIAVVGIPGSATRVNIQVLG